MATIKVVGDVAVITSSLKLEDIQRVQKYRPEALTLMGGDEGKTPIFKVEARPGTPGSVSVFGITFGSAGHSEAGLATVTVPLTVPAGTDVKNYVADKYGSAIANLQKLETAIPTVLEAVNAERTTLMSAITVE